MHLSIFDLDKTLLNTNISFKFYSYLYKKNNFSKFSIVKLLYYFIKFKFFNMDIQKLHNVVFKKFLKKQNLDIFLKDVDIFLDKYLDKIFYMPSILKLQKAIFNNHKIAIFSSSVMFLVEPIAKILKVDEYRATKYLFDKDNRFDKIDVIMDGKQKAKEAKALIEKLKITKENVSVYSDSFEDIDLFEVAKEKIAVQPSRRLKQKAERYSWEII